MFLGQKFYKNHFVWFVIQIITPWQ